MDSSITWSSSRVVYKDKFRDSDSMKLSTSVTIAQRSFTEYNIEMGDQTEDSVQDTCRVPHARTIISSNGRHNKYIIYWLNISPSGPLYHATADHEVRDDSHQTAEAVPLVLLRWWRQRVSEARKRVENHPQCTRSGSNLDLPIFGSLVQHKSSVLNQAATEAGYSHQS
ncbi:unnamed protein product [Timema podura]|uniref:Uncharacterized protein n=1 Tax=Timema podura TaxID=61482 RepID=A0ABN7NIF9_TIMPD|nr:unnamed protein product [Timema podura]